MSTVEIVDTGGGLEIRTGHYTARSSAGGSSRTSPGRTAGRGAACACSPRWTPSTGRTRRSASRRWTTKRHDGFVRLTVDLRQLTMVLRVPGGGLPPRPDHVLRDRTRPGPAHHRAAARRGRGCRRAAAERHGAPYRVLAGPRPPVADRAAGRRTRRDQRQRRGRRARRRPLAVHARAVVLRAVPRAAGPTNGGSRTGPWLMLGLAAARRTFVRARLRPDARRVQPAL